jgi:hypothetical protein
MTNFKQSKFTVGMARIFLTVAMIAAYLVPGSASAAIIGEDLTAATSVTLTASEGHVSVADGASVYSWGYSLDGSPMQLPGPTLFLQQGQTITVTLNNELPAAAGNASIVFPGLETTGTSGGVPGLLTREATNGGSVSYTITANEPGTYQYHSGTRSDLQVEMGLYGAIIVRPSTVAAGCSKSAYGHSETCYDREFLFLLSEIDLQVHQAAEDQASGPGPIDVGTGEFHSVYWLLNGRTGPDTMAAANVGTLPNQPYNAFPHMEPGEKLLLRVVGANREMHPFHTHGNHARVLARDGRLIVSETDTTKLAGPLLFTIPSVPGGTVDAVFEWTGKDLGWDMYGHAPGDATEPNEWIADHGKPIPVQLPSLTSLAFGGFYSGSPYLGTMSSLPPGEGGLNPNSGFAYMWHSHTERELVNNDVFPGGMMTMLIIEAPGTLSAE